MAFFETFDSRQLRNVLGTFATGVTIVTTRDRNGVAHGVTANSFSSVSLDPPLVLWSQAYTSKSIEAFQQADHFAINILADDQIALSNHFAKSVDDKFATIPHTSGLGGVPVLPGTSAHFECVKEATYPGGDHIIYIGRVQHISHSGRRPLAFAHGRYMIPYAHELGPLALGVRTGPAPTAQVVRAAMQALPGLAQATGGPTVTLSVWGNHGPTIIATEPGSGPVDEQLGPGLVLSPTRSAAGRVFAAHLAPDLTKALIDEDLRLFRVADEDDKVQRSLFDEALAKIKSDGTSHVADATQTSVSAPVFNAAGEMVLALSLVGSVEADGTAAKALVNAAKMLSQGT